MNLFHRYSTEFGFTIPDRAIIVDDVRVRGIGRSSIEQNFESSFSSEEPSWDNVSTKLQCLCFHLYNYSAINNTSLRHVLYRTLYDDQNGLAIFNHV